MLPLGGFDGFTNSFESQVSNQLYSELVSGKVMEIAGSTELSVEEFITAFDNRVTGVSNSLLILIAPILSGMMFLLNFRKSTLAYHHIVVGFCFGSFVITLSWLANMAVVITLLFDRLFPANLFQFIRDGTVTPVQITITLFYSFYFFNRLYGGRKWINFLKALLVALPVLFVSILIYRFLLLWITLYSVAIFP